MDRKTYQSCGFTLIELSIVLVIIGLIVGGVLVGRDLIAAAEIRAAISQMEQLNTAVNTFRGKYGYLPGDIPEPAASQYGFAPRGTVSGQGDGNGIIMGWAGGGSGSILAQAAGETATFWVDLTYANGMNLALIPGNFNIALPATKYGTTLITGTTLDSFFPKSRLGKGNYIVVYTDGKGSNFFAIQAIQTLINDPVGWISADTTTMTVAQAYNIDKKIDDGIPYTGRVTAQYQDFGLIWVGFGGADPVPGAYSLAGGATSCFDNSTSATGTPGSLGSPEHYSMEISSGANMNCALSFKFQ